MNIPSPKARTDLLCFAETIVARTRGLVRELWANDSLAVELKSDASPVTEIDKQTEKLVRSMLADKFPSHGVIGEEFGTTNEGSDFQWTIDPIDGTQNLVARIPTFGTLLGLRFEGRPILGLIDHPALNILCKGGTGLGISCNGVAQKIETSPSATLSPNEIIALSALEVFQRSGDIAAFEAIHRFHPNARIYNDCYAHTLTACGHIAATVEFNLKVWDFTPIEALITEAGGEFRYIGSPRECNGAQLSSAIFGRPRVVELLGRVLADGDRHS